VPAHAPDQPLKIEPAAGVDASVTLFPAPMFALQVAPQSIVPGGTLATVPAPVPARLTVSAKLPGAAVKLAVTFRAALIVTTHRPVPVQSPLQPAKVAPPVGVALSVTGVPALKEKTQVAPQSMPAGVLVTVPLPVPD
jgi:hypothetical protein